MHAVHVFAQTHVGAPASPTAAPWPPSSTTCSAFMLYLTGATSADPAARSAPRRPVLLGTSYELAARVVREESRKLFVETEIGEAGRPLVAYASALFLEVDIAHVERGGPGACADLDLSLERHRRCVGVAHR